MLNLTNIRNLNSDNLQTLQHSLKKIEATSQKDQLVDDALRQKLLEKKVFSLA